MHPWELQLLQLTTALRVWLLESISDADLAFALAGNPSIGESLRDLGRTERAYIDSFVTRRLDLAAAPPATSERQPGFPGMPRVPSPRLRDWFAGDGCRARGGRHGHPGGRVPDRPRGPWRAASRCRSSRNSPPTGRPILIAMAKIDVALRAMGRHRGEQWEDWLG